MGLTQIVHRTTGVIIIGDVMIYAICGPSKAGKTTILKELLKLQPSLHKLITLTTRPPRPNEIDGIDYYFASIERFREIQISGSLVYPLVYRNEYYAILKSELLACLGSKTISVLRPDGIPHIEKYVPVTGIFLEMDVNVADHKPEDKEIYENKNLCSYFVKNIQGNIKSAVEEVMCIINET